MHLFISFVELMFQTKLSVAVFLRKHSKLKYRKTKSLYEHMAK